MIRILIGVGLILCSLVCWETGFKYIKLIHKD